MKTYRQGDVLVIAVNSIPESVKPVERDNDRVILAYGEVTGHAHAIKDEAATLFADNDNIYLRLVSDCELSHEEHSTINIPAGDYKVIRQREYNLESGEIRYVAD